MVSKRALLIGQRKRPYGSYADYARAKVVVTETTQILSLLGNFTKKGKLVIAKLAGNHRLSRLRRILHNGMQMYTVTTKGYL